LEKNKIDLSIEMSKHNFKELKIWQRGVDLAVDVYLKTKDFPENEKFGLTSQVRRSSVSIPSNIAEGAGRTSDKAFARFLDHSIGSSNELFTQIVISERVGLLQKENSDQLLQEVEEVTRMAVSLKSKLKEV